MSKSVGADYDLYAVRPLSVTRTAPLEVRYAACGAIKGCYMPLRLSVAGTTLSLYSQPFYTSRYGYKMCARVYLNGDGVGRGSHVSLFFVIMQVGVHDGLQKAEPLRWPQNDDGDVSARVERLLKFCSVS